MTLRGLDMSISISKWHHHIIRNK